MRQRKGGDETFKSLIDRGIEVAHGEALVMVEETHNDASCHLSTVSENWEQAVNGSEQSLMAGKQC